MTIPGSVRAVACIFAATLVIGCQKKEGQGGAGQVSLAETKAIAEEGYIYGLPLVMNYAIMNAYAIDQGSGQFKGPINQISNEANVYTDKDVLIPLPNSDTPYSVSFMDLRTEPLVLSVPAVEGKRYYSVMLCDGNTYNYGYIGTRTTGSDAGDFMVVGPDWNGEAPKGIKKVFRASNQFSLAAFRTQLFGPRDIDNVRKIQAGYKIQPLSSYLHQPAPPPAAAISFPKINKEMVKTGFFGYLDFVLQFAPPTPEEKDIRAKLARIGVGPGKSFDYKDLSLAQKGAVLLGMKSGDAKVDTAIKGFGTEINGWNVAAIFGDHDFYHGDWLKRAAAAKFGIFGNSAEEALYPIVTKESDGTPLDGSKHKYTLTFAANQTPPVEAFWSLTMYDPKTQHLIKNPIDRFLLNSEMLTHMKKNHDGSVSLLIQKDSPGKANEANWLPSPDGPIYMLLRLYVPNATPPSILPVGSGTWQPPPIMQVR